jgi:hypothetical protein
LEKRRVFDDFHKGVKFETWWLLVFNELWMNIMLMVMLTYIVKLAWCSVPTTWWLTRCLVRMSTTDS